MQWTLELEKVSTCSDMPGEARVRSKAKDGIVPVFRAGRGHARGCGVCRRGTWFSWRILGGLSGRISPRVLKHSGQHHLIQHSPLAFSSWETLTPLAISTTAASAALTPGTPCISYSRWPAPLWLFSPGAGHLASSIHQDQATSCTQVAGSPYSRYQCLD